VLQPCPQVSCGSIRLWLETSAGYPISWYLVFLKLISEAGQRREQSKTACIGARSFSGVKFRYFVVHQILSNYKC